MPSRPEAGAPSLDATGVSSAIRDLAAEVAGQGPVAERVRRIETFLSGSFDYTLDFVGRRSGAPIDDFLFRYRSGHCEYFASAMVLMLRTQGIPARFVTGFLGAEFNPLEGYYIVRQSNAHAWVEAYVPEVGWQTFDPTPPAGRPGLQPVSLWALMRQAYDWIHFRWDRYVISYSATDQARVLRQVISYWSSWWRRQFGDEESGWKRRRRHRRRPEAPAASEPGSFLSLWPALLLLCALAVLVWWRSRATRSATAAYLSLRRSAQRHGCKIDASTPPEAFGALVFGNVSARRETDDQHRQLLSARELGRGGVERAGARLPSRRSALESPGAAAGRLRLGVGWFWCCPGPAAR